LGLRSKLLLGRSVLDKCGLVLWRRPLSKFRRGHPDSSVRGLRARWVPRRRSWWRRSWWRRRSWRRRTPVDPLERGAGTRALQTPTPGCITGGGHGVGVACHTPDALRSTSARGRDPVAFRWQRHRSAGLHPLRAVRRGTFRQDGSQRDRIRRHGRVRRGTQHSSPCQRRKCQAPTSTLPTPTGKFTCDVVRASVGAASAVPSIDVNASFVGSFGLVCLNIVLSILGVESLGPRRPAFAFYSTVRRAKAVRRRGSARPTIQCGRRTTARS